MPGESVFNGVDESLICSDSGWTEFDGEMAEVDA